jgi:DNA-directed RNA polymerase beta subunit
MSKAQISDRDYVHTLDSFFEQPNILFKHQLESYNTFVRTEIGKLLKQKSPLQFIVEKKAESLIKEIPTVKYFKVIINLLDYKLLKPYDDKFNSEKISILPDKARQQKFTYSSDIYFKMDYSVQLLNINYAIEKTISHPPVEEKMGELPVMYKSELDNIYGLSKEGLQRCNEDPYDLAGYFIIRGEEKFIVPQEKRIENYIFLHT